MKKPLAIAVFLAVPVIAVFLYLVPSGMGLDVYAASVALGVVTVALVGWQFVLASRPKFLIDAFGLKGILAFHMSIPVFLVALAFAHHLVKTDASGFLGGLAMDDDTLQARFGSVVLVLFACLVAFSVLFFANTFVTKRGPLKIFREFILKTFNLSYKTMRLFHDATTILALGVCVHVLLAGSASFAFPGLVFLCVWLGFSLILFARYKILSIKNGSPKRGSGKIPGV